MAKQISIKFRELGKIESVFCGREDHGIFTCWIYIEFPGSSQGFGGLSLNDVKLATDFVNSIVKTFGIRPDSDLKKSLESLKGQKCYALRCFENGHIEGLEALNGNRFVINVWRKKHFPDTKSVLSQRKEQIKHDIASHKEAVKRAQVRLKSIEQEYLSWE